MANSAKNKGDRAEREAVAWLIETAPELVDEGERARRKLGAGAKDDEGDLRVFRDATVQVKFWDAVSRAIREAAADSQVQAVRAAVPLGVGMVKVPNARAGRPRWLACVPDGRWPVGLPDEPVPFAMASKMLAWLGDDTGPYGYLARPRTTRIALLTGHGADPVLVAPFEAWLAALAQHRSVHASDRPAA